MRKRWHYRSALSNYYEIYRISKWEMWRLFKNYNVHYKTTMIRYNFIFSASPWISQYLSLFRTRRERHTSCCRSAFFLLFLSGSFPSAFVAAYSGRTGLVVLKQWSAMRKTDWGKPAHWRMEAFANIHVVHMRFRYEEWDKPPTDGQLYT